MIESLRSIINDYDILKCMQCGKCTGSCPSGREANIRIRKIVYSAKEGIDVTNMPELWYCTTCYTCMERCPKGVKITDAVIALRNLAVRKGNYPKIHLNAIYGIRDTANGFPLSPEIVKIRSMLGLSKEPFDVAHSEKELKDFQALMQNLPLFKLIEKHLETDQQNNIKES